MTTMWRQSENRISAHIQLVKFHMKLQFDEPKKCANVCNAPASQSNAQPVRAQPDQNTNDITTISFIQGGQYVSMS